MINDLCPVHPERNLLIKFADDTNLSVPVKANCDTSSTEVNNIERWALNNRMTLNMTKQRKWLCKVGQADQYHLYYQQLHGIPGHF
jgi:hypothetical protein